MVFALNGMSLLLLFLGLTFILISFILKSKNIEVESPLRTIENSMEIMHSVEDSASERLMAINEYSDFVLQEIEKKHKELLFMYQLIQEKEKEVKTNSELKVASEEKKVDRPVREVSLNVQPKIRETAEAFLEETMNNNNKILTLYKEGKDIKTIAKSLGLGIGEVKLVIDLFKEVSDEK